MWLSYLALLGFAVVAHSAGAGTASPEAAGVLAALAPGLVLEGAAWRIASATRRPPLRLRSPADGRFVLGSPLPAPAVVAWIAGRSAVMVVARLVPILSFAVVVYLSALAPGPEVIAAVGGVVLTGGLLYAIAVPAWLAARRSRGALVGLRVAAGALGVGGAGLVADAVARAASSLPPAASLFSVAMASSLSGVRLEVPPGSWLAGALAGGWLDVAGLALLLAGCVAVAGRFAGDCFPELWETSILTFRTRALRQAGEPGSRRLRPERRTGRPAGSRTSAVPGAAARVRRGSAGADSPGADSPPAPAAARARLRGPWAIAWKALVVSRRDGFARRFRLGVAVFAAGGAAVGAYANGTPNPSGTVGSLVPLLLYLGPFFNEVNETNRLAEDLAKPLWWLSAASVPSRLVVATWVSALRMAVPVAAAATAALVVTGHPVTLLGFVPALLALTWVARATGLVMLCVLPNRADRRGPGGVARFAGFIGVLVPVAAVGVAVGAAASSQTAGFAAISGAAGLAGWLLVGIASRKLSTGGLALAMTATRA